MNCADTEQLLDAYLDGQLAGSLRLEFDAHRLRCKHCQQMVAMLESVGHVVASDTDVPALSDDFTSRVLAEVRHSQPAPARLRLRHIRLVGGVALQAAAVIVFAVWIGSIWNSRSAKPVAPVGPDRLVSGATAPEDLPEDISPAELTEYIQRRVELVEFAHKNLKSDFSQLARYPLAIKLPAERAAAAQEFASLSPFFGVLQALLPNVPEEPPHTPTAADEYAF